MAAKNAPVLDVLQSDHCAQMLRLLGDAERLRIIQALRDGPRNVGEIAKRTRQKIANVSHHLKALREGGLVEATREGRFVMYRLLPGTYVESAAGKFDHLDIGCCRLEIPKPRTARRR
jgi:DNA-binding transcriptional ArsR family regulator